MDSVLELQDKYAKFVGAKYAVACNSGTSALHLALMAIGIKKGDEVICPDFTMAACGFAISYTGARPVFVDCGADLNIDVTQIKKHITKKTKAIMVVHIYGRLCDMKEIVRIARKYKLKIIEDGCEAQGAIYKSKADISCFSFYKNKIIHAEEGGICTTNSVMYKKRMDYLKCMTFDKNHSYFHTEIGYNYRMPESQAILALKSLQEYHDNAKKRRQVEMWYNKHLNVYSHHDAVWVYTTVIPWNKRFADIQGVRQFFKPLSTMPMWKKQNNPVAKFFSKFCYLPVYPDMTEDDVIKLTNKLSGI